MSEPTAVEIPESLRSRGSDEAPGVLEAVLEEVADGGYRDGSFARIAAAAQVPEAQLRAAFPDERILLVDAMRYRDERAARALPEGRLDGRGLLEAFLAVARRATAAPGTVELFATLSSAAAAPEHPGHDYFRERYAWLRDMIENALRELEEEGELKRRADPRDIATQTLALFDGLQVQWLLDRSAVDLERQLRGYLNLHLHHGLQPALD